MAVEGNSLVLPLVSGYVVTPPLHVSFSNCVVLGCGGSWKEGLNGSPQQKLEFLFFPPLLLSQLLACPWLLPPRIFLVTVACIVGSFDELAALAEESGWFSTQLVS